MTLRCKAHPDCTENHNHHCCKFCKDEDSDHKSNDCPQRGTRCKAWPACKENHVCHFCRLCGDPDADHRSENCSARNKATLFHGTLAKFASSINTNGMRPSTGGRFGKGVYATTDYEAAKKVATRHGKLGVVVTLEVDLGYLRNCYDAKNLADGTWTWREKDGNTYYDSAYAQHPPWAGLEHLREYVIADSTRCRVKQISKEILIGTDAA